MSTLRISICLLLCAVFVQAYSDYYRPISKKHHGPRKHHGPAPSKYAATMLSPPSGLPKMNRFYRPRMRAPVYGGGKMHAGYGGGIRAGAIGGSLVGGHTKGTGKGYSGKVLAKIPVKTSHQIKFRDYPIKSGYSAHGVEHEVPQIIEVMAKSIPLSLVFRSTSSKINIKQLHHSEHAKQHNGPQQSYSVDEPHVLKHTVQKPIVQMIQEVVVPYRKITQTIQPVQEHVITQVATHKAPAVHNAYQLEPVLYVSPEAINSQAEYKHEPALGSVKVEGYHGEPQPLLVSQFAIDQHLAQPVAHPVALLEQQAISGYEPVQPVAAMPVEAPVAPVQPVAQAEVAPVAAVAHSEPQYTEQISAVPAPPPVALVADASLLDTYMKYAQISAEDLLLPVYQATHVPETYAPKSEHAPQLEAFPVVEAAHLQQVPLPDHKEQPQYNAAPVVEQKAYKK